MTLKIIESTVSDLGAMRQFLLDGFREPDSYVPFLPEVLSWKYFSCNDGFSGPKSFLVLKDGHIVAHIGLCYRSFSLGNGARTVLAVHPIDWYSSPQHPGAGASLMLKVFTQAPIQYVIGGTEIAKRAHRLMGFRSASTVSVFRKMLRPSYPMTRGSGRLTRRIARSARNMAYTWWTRGDRPRVPVSLQEVKSFDAFIDGMTQACGSAVISGRNAQLLNHFLDFPTGGFFGHLVQHEGKCIGFAVLREWHAGKERHGAVAECTLDTDDPLYWCSTYRAIGEHMRARGVDVVTAYSCTSIRGRELVSAGFHLYRETELFVRDRDGLIEPGKALQLSKLEADHSYL